MPTKPCTLTPCWLRCYVLSTIIFSLFNVRFGLCICLLDLLHDVLSLDIILERRQIVGVYLYRELAYLLFVLLHAFLLFRHFAKSHLVIDEFDHSQKLNKSPSKFVVWLEHWTVVKLWFVHDVYVNFFMHISWWSQEKRFALFTFHRPLFKRCQLLYQLFPPQRLMHVLHTIKGNRYALNFFVLFQVYHLIFSKIVDELLDDDCILLMVVLKPPYSNLY